MSRRAGTDLGQDDPRQGLVPRIGLLWPEGSVLLTRLAAQRQSFTMTAPAVARSS